MNFGENLKRVRTLQGFTTQELAKKMGISRSYLSLIETGKRMPAKKKLKKIAAILHIKYDLIVQWYISDLEKKITEDD